MEIHLFFLRKMFKVRPMVKDRPADFLYVRMSDLAVLGNTHPAKKAAGYDRYK